MSNFGKLLLPNYSEYIWEEKAGITMQLSNQESLYHQRGDIAHIWRGKQRWLDSITVDS